MTEPTELRGRTLIGAAGCSLLVLTALGLVIVVGPQQALFSHLVEATVAAIAWLALAVVCALRGRRTKIVLVIATAWSLSAAAGGWALLLLSGPHAVFAAWVSVWTWAIGVGLSFTLGVLEATRWPSPRVLTTAAWISIGAMAFAFATLPTVTIQEGIAFPNPIALPVSPTLGALGAVSTTIVAFAAIATIAVQATSPARRRATFPALAAAIVGIAAIGAGALANEWAPLVQALTVPLLPATIAVTVFGATRRSLRSVSAQLEGAADPSSALNATLAELSHDLGLPGLAIDVDGQIVASVGRPGDNGVPLINLGRREGYLMTPALDQDAEAEIARVSPSIAAVLASARLIDRVRRSRAELAVAREEERRRVRRDLHDEVGPLLSAVVVQTDVASLLLERSPERSRQSLAKVRTASGDAIIALRRIVRDLDPVTVDTLGLLGALEELAFRLSGPTDVSVTSTPVPALTAAVEMALYRIAAEGASNAVRHAAATSVTISVTAGDGTVALTVADDGIGFDTDHAVAGVGIGSMRDRAAELNGTLSIVSGSAGTTIRAELPIPV